VTRECRHFCLAFECYLEDCSMSLDGQQRTHAFRAEIECAELQQHRALRTIASKTKEISLICLFVLNRLSTFSVFFECSLSRDPRVVTDSRERANDMLYDG